MIHSKSPDRSALRVLLAEAASPAELEACGHLVTAEIIACVGPLLDRADSADEVLRHQAERLCEARQERDALMTIVRAVAEGNPLYPTGDMGYQQCAFCDGDDSFRKFAHEPLCAWLRASKAAQEAR